MEKHLERLNAGMRSLKLRPQRTQQYWKDNIDIVLRENGLSEARVRLVVWEHNGKRRRSIIAEPLTVLPESRYVEGYKALLVKVKRKRSLKTAHVKSIDYRSFLSAYRRAELKGYDEALLEDSKGYLMEGSRSNVFLIQDGVIFTPFLRSGCLKGIARGVVLGIAAGMGIPVREQAIKSVQLKECDEVFLTNSVLEVMPLTKVGPRIVGTGKAGRVTLSILKEYRRLTPRV